MPLTNEEEREGIIQMDFDLLGKVLTDYAHSYDHLSPKDFIQVQNVEYDEEDHILTTLIHVKSVTEH